MIRVLQPKNMVSLIKLIMTTRLIIWKNLKMSCVVEYKTTSYNKYWGFVKPETTKDSGVVLKKNIHLLEFLRHVKKKHPAIRADFAPKNLLSKEHENRTPLNQNDRFNGDLPHIHSSNRHTSFTKPFNHFKKTWRQRLVISTATIDFWSVR